MTIEALRRLLFDCLCAREDDAATLERLETLSDQEWTSLIDMADEQMVGPMLWHRLLSPSLKRALPDQVRQTLTSEQRRAATANMCIHRDFRKVALALHEHCIPVIVLKGLHLASLVYGDLAIRTMGDIDLLVPVKDLARAGTVTESLGYEPAYPYLVSPDPVPYSWHQLPRLIKSGATDVEIHWHIISAEATPTVNIDELWERAVPARLAGVDVQVLSPEDVLLHLCVHATCLHFCEFSARPWCDIAETIRHYGQGLSWDTVIERAGRWRGRRGTYLALRLAKDLLAAGVPNEVLLALKPADLEERIVGIAMRQRHRVRMPTAVAQVMSQHGGLERLRTIWRRVFLPKNMLADAYNIRRSDRLPYAIYATRLRDMVKRHWRTAIRVYRGDPALTTLAADTMTLQKFLAEE